MTADMRAATACRALAVIAAVATVWLAVTGHPWLGSLAGWFAFLALFLGGLIHRGHHRAIARNRQKGYANR